MTSSKIRAGRTAPASGQGLLAGGGNAERVGVPEQFLEYRNIGRMIIHNEDAIVAHTWTDSSSCVCSAGPQTWQRQALPQLAGRGRG